MHAGSSQNESHLYESLRDDPFKLVIPIPQWRERNLALSDFKAVAHARRLTGTQKP